MYRSSTAEVMQSRTQVGEELAELERQADKLSQHAEKAIFLGRGEILPRKPEPGRRRL